MSRRPLTIFSSGGSGELDWNTVDLGDGGWSAATDPDSIISSASTASDLSTLTYNAISVGSNDYDIAGNATNATFWRVSRELQVDGAALTGADSLLLALEIDCSTGFTNGGDTEIGIGISKVPASTTRATLVHAGVVERHISTDTDPNFSAMNHTGAATQIGNAGISVVRCFISIYAGRLSEIGAIADTVDSVSSRPASIVYSSGETLYLTVFAGTRSGGTVPAATTAVAKLRWAVAKLGS